MFIGQKSLNVLFSVPAGCRASLGIYKGITLFAMETIPFMAFHEYIYVSHRTLPSLYDDLSSQMGRNIVLKCKSKINVV